MNTGLARTTRRGARVEKFPVAGGDAGPHKLTRATGVDNRVKQATRDATAWLLNQDQLLVTDACHGGLATHACRKAAHSTCSLGADLGFHLAVHLGSRRTRTPRVPEHVHLGEAHALAKRKGVLELSVRLPREAHDEVTAER